MYKNRKLLLVIAGFVSAACLIGSFAFNKINENDEAVEVLPDGKLQYKWYIPPTPKDINFAGEKTPLDRQEIKEQLDRELLIYYYSQISTLHILRQSSRYFPLIEERLRANGVPDDFKYLCIAESSLMNQTSRVGAVGFWQFMKDTAPAYGLEVSDEVDERYDVAKSTDAACQYFKKAYEKFGSWTAAAASFNCGMGGYSSQATFQMSQNYYDLLLPEETMRYVFRILAVKYVVSNAERLGFMVRKADAYKPYKTRIVTLDTTVNDLARYALQNNTTYRILKQHNPWLRDRRITVKAGKTYSIQLPAEQ